MGYRNVVSNPNFQVRAMTVSVNFEKPLQIFFSTPPQRCPYLPDRCERKIVTELFGDDPQQLHDLLISTGFRRSHGMVYKPACSGCAACVPVRIRVSDFRPSRSLRRVWTRNSDLQAKLLKPVASVEQYDLFARYQQSRHGDGGMATMSFDDYRAMVEDTMVDSSIVEFRDSSDRLVAVSLSDRLGDGLSGIYKFFDPDQGRRSAGTFIILWHVHHAHHERLPFVYLGYWIADCRKMAYKSRFSGLEGLDGTVWRRLSPNDLPSGRTTAEGAD